MRAANLNGKKVITSKAKVLGEVEGVEIAIDEWVVTHLHISLTKDVIENFDFKKPFLGSVSVCLPINTIKAVGDVISLNKTIQDLKYMKEFKLQK